MIEKLETSGVQNDVLRVIYSWLQQRTAHVVVDGVKSDPFPLSNSVYQGTTWGPPLWNHLFGDARHSVESVGFRASMFVDDTFEKFSNLSRWYGAEYHQQRTHKVPKLFA